MPGYTLIQFKQNPATAKQESMWRMWKVALIGLPVNYYHNGSSSNIASKSLEFLLVVLEILAKKRNKFANNKD